MIRFAADVSLITAQAADSTEPARIAGLAVPWDTVATVSSGQQVRFSRGAFDTGQKPAKLIENHDITQLRGIVDTLVDADAGLEFEATLADTAASRDAVALLKAGAYDSVSVGANPVKFSTDASGIMTVTEASLQEISLVAFAAFEGATITEIAAQVTDNTEQESEEMPDAETAAPIEAEATIPTQPIMYAPQRPTLPTAVEYIIATIRGGQNLDSMLQRVHAAAPEVGTTDTPGILPEPIVGPVYNNFLARRPVVDAVGVKAMPGGGKIFIRPEVTTHTSMAEQANEFDTLQSGTFVVTDNQVTKHTFGGYVSISEQDLDWTEPAVLSLILDDLGRIYANTTDNYAADQMVAGITNSNNFALASTGDPAYWATWIAEAAKDILTDSNGNMPTHLFMHPGIWQDLIGLSDTTNRPMFPQIGPMNAQGDLTPTSATGNAFGLSVIVDRNFASGTLIIGDASGFELFEQQKGAITVDSPTDLSRTLAWRGYFATLMIDSRKFIAANFV